MWKLTLSKLNYLYLFFVIIWPSISGYVGVDGRGRMVMISTLFVLFVNITMDRSFGWRLTKSPTIYWGIWIIYVLINALFKGYNDVTFDIFFMSIFLPFAVMLMVSTEYLKNSRFLLKVLLFSLIIFGLFGISTNSFSDSDRLMSELGNSLPLTMVTLSVVACVMYVRNELKIQWLIPILLFVIYIIVMAATRKALGAIGLVFIFTLLAKMDIRSPKTIFLILISSIVLYIGVDFILENTFMGERLMETEEQGESGNTTDIKILNILGDRASQYIGGWNAFIENHITGIGLNNYQEYTGSFYRLHTEYIVQLAELGLIGFIIFTTFYYKIAIGLIRIRKSPLSILLIGVLGAVMFINLTAWTHSFAHYFILFGIMIGHIEKREMMIFYKKNRLR